MSNIKISIRSDSVAVLALDQDGSKANVLTLELWAELDAALDSLAAQPKLSGLVLASAGPIQCPSDTGLLLLPAVQGVVRGALVLKDPGPVQRAFVIVPGGSSGFGLVNPGPGE